MAKIQFTGIRNLGKLFGILSQRSVPTELNIEDGISVVYVVNETIQEELGRTYRYNQSGVIGAADATGFFSLDPWSSAPSIPDAFRPNAYLVRFTVTLSSSSAGDWQDSSLVLSQITGDILLGGVAAIAGEQPIAFYNLLAVSGSDIVLASRDSPSPFISPLPFKLPSDGVFPVGAGNELRFSTDKAVGANDITMRVWADFWAGPPGVRCPWL